MPRMRIADYKWRGFGHTELSKIASAIAGRMALCCCENAPTRRSITVDKGRLKRLEEFAYDSLGCAFHEPAIHERYLQNFLESV